MIAIRGAITADENTREEILLRTEELLSALFERNNLTSAMVSAIFFTATHDLDAAYPAVAARSFGLTQAALSCTQEMRVAGSLTQCIRCTLFCKKSGTQAEAVPVYLRGAKVLRPDLTDAKVRLPQKAVAIDGPAGSGKSTVAKALARHLGYTYIDTGAMYRAVGLYCLQNGIDPKEEAAVESALPSITLFLPAEAPATIWMNGKDVTEAVRSLEVGRAASLVAALLPVREYLVREQRAMAEKCPVVMDGRDIGTHVLPDAMVKIYLNASEEVRARRREAELLALGEPVDPYQLMAQIKERDRQDMTREHSPLRKASDAIELDVSELDAQAVEQALFAIVRGRIKD